MKKILISIFLLFLVLGFIFIGYTDNRAIFTIKNSIPLELRLIIKKTLLFPFYHQSEINEIKKSQNKLISRTQELENQNQYLIEYLNDLDFLEKQGKNIFLPQLGKSRIIESKNNNKYKFKKFYFALSKPWQYNERKPSGYLTKHEDKIFILNGEGLLGFFETSDLNADYLNFNIERLTSYYIYKIILPIIFILAISWSVFWVRGSQIDAKVNVTIVCLLALIAYNFIIDEDLPKLPYLTFLDAFILLSYFFTGIATVLCVYSYVRHTKSGKDLTVVDEYAHVYGPLLYFISLLAIGIYFFSLDGVYKGLLTMFGV